MYEYTMRKSYPFVVGVPAPVFSNSYIYIITNCIMNTEQTSKSIFTYHNLYFIYLTPAYSYAANLTFTWHIFFLFAMNFILLARDKTKKYLQISHRIINHQTFLGSLHYRRSTHTGPMPPFQ